MMHAAKNQQQKPIILSVEAASFTASAPWLHLCIVSMSVHLLIIALLQGDALFLACNAKLSVTLILMLCARFDCWFFPVK